MQEIYQNYLYQILTIGNFKNMDPINIINKAVEDLDQELKKNPSNFKENLYLHLLSIYSNKTIEKIIETKIFKFLKIKERDVVDDKQIVLTIDEIVFTLSADQKQFSIYVDDSIVLDCVFKITPQEAQLIKISLDKNIYKNDIDIETAKNLLKSRIECVTQLENMHLIIDSFNKLDIAFFKMDE